MDTLTDEVTEALDYHGLGEEAYRLWCDNMHADHTDVDNVEEARDAYMGCAWTAAEWAEDYADQTGMLDAIPDDLRGYFDYSAWMRDACLSGDLYVLTEDDGTAHVFHG